MPYYRRGFEEYGMGMVAGFLASFVVALVVLAQQAGGLVPQFDLIGLIAAVLRSDARFAGWLGHAVVGTVVWGVLYVALLPVLPGRAFWVKALAFSLLAWLAMMLVFMPVAGQGAFGYRLGPAAVALSLVLHLVYGAVQGIVYSELEVGRALAAPSEAGR